MTHNELVDRARRWLAARCPVVITEMTHGETETPDAIGFGGCKANPILIECKISKSDYYADKSKAFRRGAILGMGRHRYYMTPPDLIPTGKGPYGWGILEVCGKIVRVRKKPLNMLISQRNIKAEQSLLCSCIRRIGQVPHDDFKIKCYSYFTESASVTVSTPTPTERRDE